MNIIQPSPEDTQVMPAELGQLSNLNHHNTTNRRQVRSRQMRNEKGRGCNKTKLLSQRVYVDVNERLQPISNSSRQLSSLIGCLARDPRRLPLDCWDWRLIEKEKKDAVWEEVKVYI